jgi:hypothetical protein
VWKVGQASWEQLNYTMLSVAGKGIFVAKSTFLVVLLPAYMLMKIFQWLISIENEHTTVEHDTLYYIQNQYKKTTIKQNRCKYQH